MSATPSQTRIDTASRIIKASPQKIYDAHLDPESIASWRPPDGMTCEIYSFHPFEGGTYRMSFGYKDQQIQGKSNAHEDVFTGKFLKLAPNEKIVEAVDFESEDPTFKGTMKMTTSLKAVSGGTEVTITAEDVPPGIKPEDHQEGIRSTLKNLAEFVE